MMFPKETHPHNPPETWKVQKITPRNWALTTADTRPYNDVDGWDHRCIIATFPRRKDAAMAKTVGFWVDLYEKERRWYAGEQVAGWKPYADV
jgi:hypothetical protein